jgi:hypothetical protein
MTATPSQPTSRCTPRACHAMPCTVQMNILPMWCCRCPEAIQAGHLLPPQVHQPAIPQPLSPHESWNWLSALPTCCDGSRPALVQGCIAGVLTAAAADVAGVTSRRRPSSYSKSVRCNTSIHSLPSSRLVCCLHVMAAALLLGALITPNAKGSCALSLLERLFLLFPCCRNHSSGASTHPGKGAQPAARLLQQCHGGGGVLGVLLGVLLSPQQPCREPADAQVFVECNGGQCSFL